MTTLSITILCLIIAAIPAVLYLLYRSPPVPPMRTADHKQIERETADIQRNGDEAWWKRAATAVGFVIACMLVAALVVPK